jgi:hypothetical protein
VVPVLHDQLRSVKHRVDRLSISAAVLSQTNNAGNFDGAYVVQTELLLVRDNNEQLLDDNKR